MSGVKLELDLETAEKITVAFLKDCLKWYSVERGWNKEEKEFRRKYIAALKAILKCFT